MEKISGRVCGNALRNITTTYRISLPEGYTGFELWEIDDLGTKYSHYINHYSWYGTHDAENTHCKTSHDGVEENCGLLPLTASTEYT